jgi:hypothetical protein
MLFFFNQRRQQKNLELILLSFLQTSVTLILIFLNWKHDKSDKLDFDNNKIIKCVALTATSSSRVERSTKNVYKSRERTTLLDELVNLLDRAQVFYGKTMETLSTRSGMHLYMQRTCTTAQSSWR